MTIRTTIITAGLIVASLASASAHAALQGRDLNGNLANYEAYYDTVLDITWLADANAGAGSIYDNGSNTTDGGMTWANANAWAANLSFTNPLTNQTYADWRLPTVEPSNGVSFNYSFSFNGSTDDGVNITSPQSEMAYMYYVNLGNPGGYTPAGALSGCYVNSSDTCLDNVGPFSNLQSFVYWSAPEYALSPSNAWAFGMDRGIQSGAGKDSNYLYAWAVSPGDVGAVPEAQTYALMLAGLGLIGWRVRRRG
jgi:hypothetical protein